MFVRSIFSNFHCSIFFFSLSFSLFLFFFLIFFDHVRYGAAGAFGLSFNGGFLLSFWCGLGMNDFATGFTAIVNQLVPVGAALFFKLVPSTDVSDTNMGWEYLLPALALGWIGALIYLTYELKEAEEPSVETMPLVPNKQSETTSLIKKQTSRGSTADVVGGSSWV
jgi:hypothetical protein